MRWQDRLVLYLYGTPNIVGSLLGIVGVLLYFTGVIDAYWLLIVVGLYLIGVLVTPRREHLELQIQNEISVDEIRRELNDLTRKIEKRSPPEILAKVQSIKESIFSILPVLATANPGDRNVYTIRQTALDYLPKALENYLNLPPAFANVHPIRDGKTARQLLNEQLDVLDREMKEIVKLVAENDTQKLLAHGRFLEQKFQQDDFLGNLQSRRPAPLAAERPPAEPKQ